MKSKRLSLITGISFALILQVLAAGQAIGVEPVPSRTIRGAAVMTPPPVIDTNGPQPKIVVEQPTHDFGAVAPGSISTAIFKFSNKGEGVLTISDITKTCGCTVPTLDKKEYAPGEEGTITVAYSADRGTGVRTRKLFIVSNDPVNTRFELTIKASIAQKIVYEPEKLDFAIKGVKAGAAELTLKSADDSNFAIKAISSTGEAVSAEFDPNKTAARFVLKTKIDTQKTAASSSGQLEITTTHPECPTVTVPFSVLPRFKLDPPAINILSAEGGKAVDKDLWLLSNYDEDFEVASAASKEGIIKVKNQEKMGNRYKFSLSVVPPSQETSKMFTDTFIITTKDGDKMEVACRGFYQRK